MYNFVVVVVLFYSFSMKQRVYCYTSLFKKDMRKDQKKNKMSNFTFGDWSVVILVHVCEL